MSLNPDTAEERTHDRRAALWRLAGPWWLFLLTGIAWLINTARHAEPWGIKPGSKVAMLYERELEMCVETMKKMHRRGIRVCIGGDYGFAWTPQGTNAKDIQTFVELLGFTPMEAILAATALGGEIMGRPNELGKVKEGFLADLILIDGDPLADITILQNTASILAVMKDGVFHRDLPETRAVAARTAAV